MRLHSAFVIFLVMAFLLAGISQPSSIDLKDYKKAEQLYNLDNPTEATDRLALQLYQQITNKLSSNPHYDSIVFDAYLKTGILQQMSNQQRESISAFGQAEDKARTSGLADSLVFKPYLFIGTAYYALNNFDSASYYFERAEAIVLKYPRISDRERLYNKSGTLYYETGNYIQSKYYFEKALTSLDTTDIRNRYLYVNYKNNIASALRKLKQPAEALAIYQSLLPLGIEKDALLQNIGDTYQDVGDFRRAERYLHQSSFTNEKKFNDLGFVYLQLEAFDSSAMYLNRALAMTQDLKQKSIARGTTFSYLGHLYLAQRKPAYALNYYQQALVQLDPDFNDQRLAANPVDYEGIHSFSNLFETLTGKANAFYMLFNDSNNADHL